MSDTTEKHQEDERPSGRFLLRIDPDLHTSLRHEARDAGVSLNEFCARKLALPSPRLPVGIVKAVRKASGLLDGDLLGAVAFGSWARDELVERSDIDLLFVVESERRIDRSLYRAWDRSPLEGSGRTVEPHFVHLSEAGARVTGLWAEIALDGIVLVDVDLALSRRLAEIRRRIVSGEMTRRWEGGHPYWVEVA